MIAADNGVPSLYDVSSVRFMVDRNTFPPVFTRTNRTLSITEDFPVGDTIGSCLATDNDSGITPTDVSRLYVTCLFLFFRWLSLSITLSIAFLFCCNFLQHFFIMVYSTSSWCTTVHSTSLRCIIFTALLRLGALLCTAFLYVSEYLCAEFPNLNVQLCTALHFGVHLCVQYCFIFV